MWKETKVIKNVEYYNFDARFGAYATNVGDGKSMLYIAGKEIPICEAISVCSYDDMVVVQTESEDGNSYYDIRLYSKDGELLNVVKNTFCIRREPDIRYNNVFTFRSDDNIRYANFVDIETGNKIFEKDYPEVREVFDNMIFCMPNNSNAIIRYDWDGNIMWQRDYQSDFNVEIALGDIEGVCGGKLWVKSKYDGHEILLAIDVNTGKLVKAFSDSEEDTDLPHCNLGEIDGFYINVENDHILVLAYDEDYNLFWNFIDANTLKTEERTKNSIDYDYFDGMDYGFGIADFRGDYIVGKLMTWNVDRHLSGFAVYNYKTKKVVFAHRLFSPEQTKEGLEISNNANLHYYNNGRILVHDFANNLHIFEDVKD
ncbi:MAG: hypothetical protein II908_02635 [Bacteroidaceae bacterium]|nr:hypothetical protein [Bacteroidaceae bacterium]